MAVAQFRQGRNEPVPLSMEDRLVEDHLIAFSYWIQPLKSAITKLLDAGIHVFKVLRPGVEVPASASRLAEGLMKVGDRLNKWRFSAGRAGTEEALSYILSWYETIDFDLVQTCRTASPF